MEDFLTKLAIKMGKLIKGGDPNLNNVAVQVINDWQRVRLSLCIPSILFIIHIVVVRLITLPIPFLFCSLLRLKGKIALLRPPPSRAVRG